MRETLVNCPLFCRRNKWKNGHPAGAQEKALDCPLFRDKICWRGGNQAGARGKVDASSCSTTWNGWTKGIQRVCGVKASRYFTTTIGEPKCISWVNGKDLLASRHFATCTDGGRKSQQACGARHKRRLCGQLRWLSHMLATQLTQGFTWMLTESTPTTWHVHSKSEATCQKDKHYFADKFEDFDPICNHICMSIRKMIYVAVDQTWPSDLDTENEDMWFLSGRKWNLICRGRCLQRWWSILIRWLSHQDRSREDGECINDKPITNDWRARGDLQRQNQICWIDWGY